MGYIILILPYFCLGLSVLCSGSFPNAPPRWLHWSAAVNFNCRFSLCRRPNCSPVKYSSAAVCWTSAVASLAGYCLAAVLSTITDSARGGF